MRLFDRFADNGFHSSIVTTFSVDFDAYESVALSRMRGAGCRNNFLVGDGRLLNQAVTSQAPPRHAGKLYTLNAVLPGRGVFHPKLFLQFGRKTGRMIVGSANLTSAGLAGNLELVDSITFDGVGEGERQLVRQAWDYAAGFLEEDRPGTAHQIAWLLDRTPWLTGAGLETGAVTLQDGSQAAFLTESSQRGIGERFASMIDAPVRRLIVVSPYWDRELAALSDLSGRIGPHQIDILVDRTTNEFPADAVSDGRIRLYDGEVFLGGRFLHAKAIIAQTEEADHVLLGSANCTRAALGAAGFPGMNAEACLYRRLPPDGVIEALRLNEVFREERLLSSADLPRQQPSAELPLADMERAYGGAFDIQGDRLRWYPPDENSANECQIALLDGDLEPLTCKVRRLGGVEKGFFSFSIEGDFSSAIFASVRFREGHTSGPMALNWVDVLRFEIREPHSAETQHRIDTVASDPDATLMLLELFDELCAVEDQQEIPKASVPKPNRRSVKDEKSPDTAFRTLSYEEFIAKRTRRSQETAKGHNSLASSELAIVRGILNRVVGFGDGRIPSQSETQEEGAPALFDLGDETDDPENEVEKGRDFRSPDLNSNPGLSADEEVRERLRRRRMTRLELVDAVDWLQEELTHPGSEQLALTSRDLLRLRVLLVILCNAGSALQAEALQDVKQEVGLRVLPLDASDEGWPRLMGRVLFTMFGGNNPPIRRLEIAGDSELIPEDFEECWATCYWCMQACLMAPIASGKGPNIRKALGVLATALYRFTLPTIEEALSDRIVGMMDRMADRYAAALGIEPSEISNGHRELVLNTLGDDAGPC